MATASTSTDAPDDANSDIAQLGYEAARDELASIVTRLESGGATLEDSMRLWERGEALAAHCESWLDGAQQRIAQMTDADTADGE
ncbi:exodeoxyribonuclease VII small subunit [Leekyejoonella antrihumi]|uniref:Exodeoxyribonuclease 7 small subunit n=1 Tax=Leekyejoonella antrihumi TaxID=1660198 RepID=A0A563E4T8_9MICO|nr:exodeoxyribonuclease VII small subunit [Leekyejoonella antrihumi]TWP37425.1 exodeoxyribonuclease VII small subunit [Leekyejoonella antrihumi]